MSDRGSRAPARDWYDLVIETIALRGWTKTELSERSGVTRPTIERWATGRRTPQSAPVNAVADALGIPRERAVRLANIVTDPRAAPDRSPPPRLSEATRQRMRDELGDEIAAQLIAQADHMASGRDAAAEGDPPRGSAPRERRSAG